MPSSPPYFKSKTKAANLSFAVFSLDLKIVEIEIKMSWRMICVARSTVYNNIVTEEKWNMVNKENKSLLDEWIEYLHSVDRSNGTITQYVNDAKIFFVWLMECAGNKFFVDINKRDIMKFQNYLLNTLKQSPNRIRRLKSCISSLSNYIESMLDDVYPQFRNIVNKIPAPAKEAVRDKTVLEEDQVDYLLKYLVDKEDYQRACLFALAAFSGSRKSELLRFKVSYFKDEYIVNGLYKTPEKIRTKGRGKLGKQIPRFVIANYFKPYFELWLNKRKELGVPEDMDNLFVAYKDEEWRPMKVSTIDSWADSFGKILNVEFYMHSLRHYYTTMLYKSGIPSEVIKQIVGWESVEMVSTYTDIKVEDELDKYFTDDGIKTQ